MRKKPDILLLLSVLVVSGVLISHFVIINRTDSNSKNISQLNMQYSQFQREMIKSQDLARIDLSKQQIR